jgi:hypothetical protein
LNDSAPSAPAAAAGVQLPGLGGLNQIINNVLGGLGINPNAAQAHGGVSVNVVGMRLCNLKIFKSSILTVYLLMDCACIAGASIGPDGSMQPLSAQDVMQQMQFLPGGLGNISTSSSTSSSSSSTSTSTSATGVPCASNQPAQSQAPMLPPNVLQQAAAPVYIYIYIYIYELTLTLS